jgi:hypothetical protein
VTSDQLRQLLRHMFTLWTLILDKLSRSLLAAAMARSPPKPLFIWH